MSTTESKSSENYILLRQLTLNLVSTWPTIDRNISYCMLRFVWERSFREEGMIADRRRIGQDQGRTVYLWSDFFFPLTEEWGSQATYCLSLMNNMNDCEKEQRQLQRKQINVKTKKCFLCIFNLNTQKSAFVGRLAVHILLFQACNAFLLKAKSSQHTHSHTHTVLSTVNASQAMV